MLLAGIHRCREPVSPARPPRLHEPARIPRTQEKSELFGSLTKRRNAFGRPHFFGPTILHVQSNRAQPDANQRATRKESVTLRSLFPVFNHSSRSACMG